MGFSKDFAWGSATASYQVEGAAYEDGKGLSVWDEFCRRTGNIKDGDTGDTASDHYHRYVEDVALMKEMGMKAYRLSISWPRVMPDGTGRLNEKGMEFYERLIDELLKNGITPYITMYHWDYPFELYKKGGWLNPSSSAWFAEYASAIVDRLSDRVTHWITQNEPQCFIGLGLLSGIHAPGLKLSMKEVLLAGHNSLLGHGKAVQAIRAGAKQPCEIGYAPATKVMCPATGSAEDVEAARKKNFSVLPDDVFNNAWWMDPVYLGRYPEEGEELYGSDMPDYTPDDMKLISQPIDFQGFNIYSGEFVRCGADGKPELAALPMGYDRTVMGWHVVPAATYWGPKFFYERYKKPVILTENGMANIDWVSLDGKVHDPQRIDYLSRYLHEYKRAVDDGVDAKGYFCWSAMDNFEWADGFSKRFGLIYIDYETGKRTIKDSGYWYRSVIASNGENL